MAPNGLGKVIYNNETNHLCFNFSQATHIPRYIITVYGTTALSLDISYNKLTNLEGIQEFTALQELIADSNHFTDNLDIPFLPELTTLSINKNRLDDLETIIRKVAENVPSISYLSLLGNRACPDQLTAFTNYDDEDYQRYRYYVIHHLPQLQFLDSTRVQDAERKVAERIGHLTKIVRPMASEAGEGTSSPILTSLTPLPRTARNANDHRGAYGKCRYRYSGKHSEGNRFILNNDL